jgi:hypothetical protein
VCLVSFPFLSFPFKLFLSRFFYSRCHYITHCWQMHNASFIFSTFHLSLCCVCVEATLRPPPMTFCHSTPVSLESS